MTNMITKIKEELVNRFMQNNFGEITLDMKKSGEKVVIHPCSYGELPKSVEDIEYYLIYCSLPWAGQEKIEEVAEFLANFDKHLEEQEDSKNKLYDFFLKNIKGHSSEELSLGNDICGECYDMWQTVPAELKEGITFIFDSKLDDYYLSKYHSNHPEFSMDKIVKAYNLANAFETYSDWYKDVHGYRPRSLSTF